MTQGQLAVKSEVDQPSISRAISGESLPRVDRAARLAKALEVSLDWLCGLPSRTPGELTPEEDQLIKWFRAIVDDGSRQMVLTIVKDVAAQKQNRKP